MAEKKDTPDSKKKTLSIKKSFEINKIVDAGQIRQSFSHGRSKTVSVEVKRKRTIDTNDQQGQKSLLQGEEWSDQQEGKLSDAEIESRLKLLQDAKRQEEERKQLEREKSEQEVPQKPSEPEPIEETQTEEEKISEPEIPLPPPIESEKKSYDPSHHIHRPTFTGRFIDLDEEGEEEIKNRRASQAAREAHRKTLSVPKRGGSETDFRKQLHRLTVEEAMQDPEQEKMRSLASLKRAREKEKHKLQKSLGLTEEQKKIVREVIVPEAITVQELSNRMAVRSADVIKTLMRLGVMATINQVLDSDTAELVVSEFGHIIKKVAESDVETGLKLEDDLDHLKVTRPPVVTVMGHVDHGKTSLLDTIRKSSVANHEAGGITQHIGAYQITMPSGGKITFIDTPGHAAFTQMRARGANVTDIVILVVAADDGVMEQTIEAINHAKAANVPIIVAINKIDKPDARPERVKTELLSHGIVVEEMGGDVIAVEVSAKNNINIDKLEEIILLQADLLGLKANPNRYAEGVVIESKVEVGKGPVATILVQRGTLKIGDIFVAGAEWGRVRALTDENGKKRTEAGPSTPVEVLGFDGLPSPGDDFLVAENEGKAKEVVDYRKHRQKQAKVTATPKITLDLLLSKTAEGKMQELALIVKSDVQGSLEAISSTLSKLVEDNKEVALRILHTGVGPINESDITLASSTGALVIGFNVRANPQARELAAKSAVEIRYYSIIYNIIDDVKALLSGLLAPTLQEKFLGYAEIRDVFNITKVGKIAGCFVTEGVVKRGSSVRLLRDNVVIHTGKLKTLKRFKDEVKEVKSGYECGMAFESYQDIRSGDVIECFEIESIARQL